jgi:hypothetical protein
LLVPMRYPTYSRRSDNQSVCEPWWHNQNMSPHAGEVCPP